MNIDLQDVLQDIIVSQTPGAIIMFYTVSLKLWTDYKLSWNVTEYGGVQSIRLPSNMIWTPDILMYNRYDVTV